MADEPDPYKGLDQETYDRLLKEIMDEKPASNLLTISGVYEVVREELNNEILTRWENRDG